MRIRNLRVINYKSYRDTGPIAFGPGFNVVVGQNNAGKTALLEAINVETFVDNPHKRLEAGRPKRGVDVSTAHFDVEVSGAELKQILFSVGGTHAIPVANQTQAGIGDFFAQDEIIFHLAFSQNARWLNRAEQSSFAFLIHINDARTGWDVGDFGRVTSNIFLHVGEHYRRATYGFRAERLTLTASPADDNTTLSSNAANLANVILHLQTRSPARFARLNKYLRQVFPAIHGVSTKLEGRTAYLLIWTIDSSQEYEQLSVDLANCGTGIGQALAILYIVVNSDFPRVIVIDEPNSFLHPAAARTLLQILKGAGHQYIISTHAAEIVSLSEPSTLHLIRWDGEQSVLETLVASDVRDVRRALSDVGVRLSEVFGVEEILWVEGQTEQECFPRLLLFKYEFIPAGFAVIAVKNTGDFEGKRAKAAMVWDVYNRLSEGNALVPPAVAFSFDREGRNEQEIADLQRQSKSRVNFLPRRTYENYLIDADALAVVISGELADEAVSSSDILFWLQKNGSNPAYGATADWNGNLTNQNWLQNVWASKFLSDLFTEVSKSKLEYRKATHSVRLTEWLLLNKPDHLLPVIEYVSSLVQESQSFRALNSDS